MKALTILNALITKNMLLIFLKQLKNKIKNESIPVHCLLFVRYIQK